MSFNITNTMMSLGHKEVYSFASWNALVLLVVRALTVMIVFFFNAAAGALIGLSGERGELIEVIASRLCEQSQSREWK